MTSVKYLTPGIFRILSTGMEFESIVFHVLVVICRSGLKELKRDMTSFSNPLKTDNTMISAIVPMVTPDTEIAEMIFIMLCDFFETK